MDQLAALRAFVRIVETRSFTKAAAQLGMPRSTVSKALHDLEVHLGTKLVQRTTRSVSLTIEGTEYYERGRRLVANLDEADATLRGMGAGAKGRLRIDVHSSMANFILIPALHDFQRRYADIQLVVGIGDRPVNLVEEGVDCVVRAGPLPDTSLVAKTILRDRLVTCASPQYLARHGTPTTPATLESGHRIVGYFGGPNGEPWPLRFKGKGGTYRIPRFDTSSNDSTGLINMMAAGLGVGQTHASVIRTHLASGVLVPVLEEWTNDTFPISVMYPSAARMNARLRAFIDWIASHLYAEARADGPSRAFSDGADTASS
ncbi:MAG: LysR family transcriptional regulator [Methylobacterium frigidaeris]